MHLVNLVNKKFKYGYSLDDGTSAVVSPPKLKKIVLTQQNPKFLFYGTRTEILEWMEKNKDIIIEYESDNSSISSSNLSKSTTLLPTLTSSPPTPPVSSPSSSNRDNDFFINSPTITTTSPESTFLENYKNIDDNTLTFNLYGIVSDELVSCKPMNFAINYLTCFDVLLEIFPTNLLNKDYKKYLPIKTTILPSGVDLKNVSRELEKSWKQTSLTNHYDNLLSSKYINDIPIVKKARSANSFKDGEDDLKEGEKRRNSFSELFKEKMAMIEVEEDANNYNRKPFSLRQYGSNNNLLDWISTKSPTFYSNKNREGSSASSKSTPIPPGILTPYIMDDMINQMEDSQAIFSKVEEAINENNNHNNHHSEVVNLPLYEHSHGDLLLDRGSSIKRNNLL